MSQSLKIGITGGIGTGKSTVCRIFRALGIPIYDADSRAKMMTSQNSELIAQIKAEFGAQSYLESGELNRIFLAQTVFNQPDKLQILNHLVHPKVQQDAQNWLEEHDGKFPYLLKEAALLFEVGSYQDLDKIMTVSAPMSIRIPRILQRDSHRQLSDIQAIIAKQMPQEEKEKRADFVIWNDGKQLLIPQVLKLHNLFINQL